MRQHHSSPAVTARRKPMVLRLAVFSLGLLIMPVSVARSDTWGVSEVDSTGHTHQWSAIALDEFTRPSIAFVDSNTHSLKLATWDAGAWSVSTVVTPQWVPGQIAYVLAPDGHAALVYRSEYFKFAENVGGWQFTTIDSYPSGPQLPSLVFDSSGDPHIVYEVGRDSTLRHVWRSGGTWYNELVVKLRTSIFGAACNSMSIDDADQLHVAFNQAATSAQYYAKRSSSGWTIEVIDSLGRLTSGSLSLYNGDPFVAYSTSLAVKLARRVNGAWQSETVEVVDDTGWPNVCVKMDSTGAPHVVYTRRNWVDASNYPFDLRYATKSGGAWSVTRVDTADVGLYCSVELANGAPHIAYCGVTPAPLKWARILDATAPEQLSELRIDGATASSVTLGWTAPGDDGSIGRASSYEVRRNSAPLSSQNWNASTAYGSAVVPSAAGTDEALTWGSLPSGVWMYFGLRAIDESGNAGAIRSSMCIKLGNPVTLCENGERALPWAEEIVGLDMQIRNPMKVSHGLHLLVKSPLPGLARLELLDVGGRRVLDEALEFGVSGWQDVIFAGARDLRPGVYLLRLSRGQERVVRRAVILP